MASHSKKPGRVFNDWHGIDLYDDEHSTAEEQRFIRIGLTDKGVLFVSYTMAGERTRITHARKATKTWEGTYEKERGES